VKRGAAPTTLRTLDAILLKENHIACRSIKAALDKAHTYTSPKCRRAAASLRCGRLDPEVVGRALPVQIEVRDQKELLEALGPERSGAAG